MIGLAPHTGKIIDAVAQLDTYLTQKNNLYLSLIVRYFATIPLPDIFNIAL